MRYLGIDVHTATTSWCLLDGAGTQVEQGCVATTQADLTQLVKSLNLVEPILVGQEIGGLSYFVSDIITAAGVELKSFNAAHLRMIASSRKKTDRRDAYWIAKALQTGMTPHAVYIPTGVVREIRMLLSRRTALVADRKRWYLRARSHLRRAGLRPKPARRVAQLLERALATPTGMSEELHAAVEQCQRYEDLLLADLAAMQIKLATLGATIPEVVLLQTIPGIGLITALALYATIGDIGRFANPRHLASYVGLVPSVRQSGETQRLGGITKQGCRHLRSLLVQSAHAVMTRTKSSEAAPLRAIGERVKAHRGRFNIAIVAVARHLLRISYHVMRTKLPYDATRLLHNEELEAAA